MILTRKTIAELPKTDKERVYFDDMLKGFGVRVRKNSSVYVVVYRNSHNLQKKLTIGKTTVLTPTEARERAKKILADVLFGKDPQSDKIERRDDMTVPDMVRFYISERRLAFKENTTKYYQRVLRTRIIPLLSNTYMKEAKPRDMQKFYNDILSGKSIAPQYRKDENRKHVSFANSAIQLVSSAYMYAIAQEMTPFNPCTNIKRMPSPNRKFFLDDNGLTLFGKTLKEITYYHSLYIDAIRLIALTGCRKNEILTLKWKYIDFEEQIFHFPDTKTGPQDRPFGSAAKRLMMDLKEKFPNTKKDALIFGEQKQASKKVEHLFGTYIKRADGLDQLMPHSLRHTFASMAASLGYSDSVIAALLGHKLSTMTSRYTHLTDTVRTAAADVVSERIDGLMKKGEASA